ncbi:glycosyltransferase family 4 protein, partial [Acinetobacter baumannii]|nr:glycosyltransferase family 4 protein [Acinetobacter baumannii]
MKILLLTQWFDPEPTFKGLAFAKELQRQGHEVEVLTGFPNYPGGKIYDGYKLKLYQREQIDGISILRVVLYPNHDNSALKRIFNYISFAFMAMLFGIFATKKADIIYAYHPPLTVGIAAVFIKFFRRIPIVYDIQDMWPDTLKATGMLNNQRLLNIIGSVCQLVYKFVDHIVVL